MKQFSFISALLAVFPVVAHAHAGDLCDPNKWKAIASDGVKGDLSAGPDDDGTPALMIDIDFEAGAGPAARPGRAR